MNEAFAAHFSLYGALCFDVPRIFWPGRPSDIYSHYAQNVHAMTGQGYSIHHVTGWFLNFGIPGVILGALILGGIWVMLYNNFTMLNVRQFKYLLSMRLFIIIAPWTFAAYLPSLIRGGIEGYKGVILEALLFPWMIMAFASLKIRLGVKKGGRSLRKIESVAITKLENLA